MRLAAATLFVVLASQPAAAQLTGDVSVVFDVLPDVDGAAGAQPVSELRARLFAERHDEIGTHLRIHLGGYVDALVADRTATGGNGTTADAIVRPADLYVDIVAPRVELRVGAARVVWGRLDEFQPTDVINPLDLSRFLMEGRSEARLPVGLVRGRLFLPKSTSVEGLVVPAFRRGRFDQLDESSSPFNLTRSIGATVSDEPDFGRDSMQGGLRLMSTTARVDWSVSAYRGLRAFPTSTLTAGDVPSAFTIRESFPRFTMVGADFETVQGAWGVRGEVAAFLDDELQSLRAVRGVPGRSLNAGVGIDRRAGDYRIAANALWLWTGPDADDPAARPFIDDDEVERTDVSVVVAADRSFARETRTLRGFAVYDPADATMFARVIGAVSLRDNFWVEGSAGLFAGESIDIIGRLTRRDFLYVRLKVFF